MLLNQETKIPLEFPDKDQYWVVNGQTNIPVRVLCIKSPPLSSYPPWPIFRKSSEMKICEIQILLYSECLFSPHVEASYPSPLRPRCTGPLSLLQDHRQSNIGLLCNNTSFRDDWLSSLQMNLMRVLLIDGYRMQPGMSTHLPIDVNVSINTRPKWTWSSSSTGDCHGVRLPGACAHERTT